MRKKISVSVITLFFAIMLNVSALSFQQRYDRREQNQESDPFVIEMTDLQVFKFLKNTYFFDFPDKVTTINTTKFFINDELGFGNQFEIKLETFNTCQLKFVLINYIGFYDYKPIGRTYYIKS